MKRIKKLLICAIIGTLTILGLSNLNNVVNAETAGPLYLGIVSLRSSGYGYEQGEKKVWKIAKYSSATNPTADLSNLIYCIKAGAGFGSENSATEVKAYTQKFDLKNKSSIPTPYSNVLPTDTNYNKLLWLIDNMYTGVGENNSTKRNAFLANTIPGADDYSNVTDDDIDVVQQLAIWYFTNPTGTYHYDDIELWVNSQANTDANYISIEDKDGNPKGWDRQNALKALYAYYINNANSKGANYTTSAATTKPIELIKANATMQTVGDNYVAGPYKINKLLDVDYTVTASYKNYGTENAITPTILVKDSNGNYVTTTKTLKELVGTEFYLQMPKSSNINGIDMTINSSYSTRTAKYWSVENSPATEQPVVLIQYTPQNFSDNATIVVPSSFDLSLRKYITAVNDKELSAELKRELDNIDVTALAAGTTTTATYNHIKDPVKVQIGDIVTYTIRVYNEGNKDGYVTQITDHLPANLKCYTGDSNSEIDKFNSAQGWVLDKNDTTERTVRTNILAKDKELTAGANKISAFNGTKLDYKYVQIKCKVVATDPMPSKLTNIADITGFTDGDGNAVVDRDSQESNVKLPSDTDLPTYNDDKIKIGEKYIPGQQDDDDFEKLILKEFDLSLRKFITKVDNTEITSRIPQVDLTALKGGTITTATYNHTKEPVKVSIGNTVIYTIRVYNEGDVDGYVNEVTDHLPDQLEYLPDNEINKKYEWTQDATNKKLIKTTYLSKNSDGKKNTYETETRSNKITAFDNKALNYKDVQVACKVVATTPMVKKITNIADISDFVDGNGNKVTDRDSQENNVKIPDDLPGYKDDEISKPYVPGQQDDDDFEKLVIGEFDLSLRKFITKVNDSEVTSRIPQVDVSKLADGTSTTATYNHPKDPILLTTNSIVTYTIRIFNEGDVAGYANEIKDDIPEGLEYLPDNQTNKTYRWVMLDKDGKEVTDISSATTIRTDYLSKEQGESRMKADTTIKTNPSLLKAFDGKALDYKDVQVAFKVTEPNTSDRIIINKAQISDDKDQNGKDVTDRDSTPDKWVEGEDDQDIEKVKVQYFDLALRKWVTQAIVIDNGKQTVTETGHKAEDDPEGIVKVDLKKSKISSVTVKFRYKIRVTNQGKIAGYAKEIKDYIPTGLKFVAQDNPLWQQVDDKTITTDQAKDILLEPGQSTEVEVLLTWINGNDNLGLQDNWAEISKDYNDFNSPDIDSTPNNNKKGEDDIDDAPVLLSVQTGQVRRYITISGIVLIVLASGVILIKKFVV